MFWYMDYISIKKESLSRTLSCNCLSIYRSLPIDCERLEDQVLSLFSGFPALSRGPGHSRHMMLVIE